MIGVISGRVLFSDGNETIIFTPSGLGYQTYCHHILPEGEETTLYISHVIREASEDLYCFKSLREKKLFELLTTVKGVGPKSAFNLVACIDSEEIIIAIQSGQKKTLTQAPGVGAKAASQIILDLQTKIQKVKMFSGEALHSLESIQSRQASEMAKPKKLKTKSSSTSSQEIITPSITQDILDDTILACENLGFSSEKIIPLAQKILRENSIKKAEQLVHLVLKEV